jgi:hypothetical protein
VRCACECEEKGALRVRDTTFRPPISGNSNRVVPLTFCDRVLIVWERCALAGRGANYYFFEVRINAELVLCVLQDVFVHCHEFHLRETARGGVHRLPDLRSGHPQCATALLRGELMFVITRETCVSFGLPRVSVYITHLV